MTKYRIKLICWDYPKSESYVDYIMDNDKPMEFETEDAAMVCLLQSAIEEVVELNFGSIDNLDNDSRKQFIPDVNGDYACIIRAWDGDDYMNVTAYDVEEVNYESNSNS